MIRLAPVTKDNWKTCIALQLSEHQRQYLPSNLYSIAEAQFYPEASPMAIYSNDDMIGFILYGRDEFSHRWKIFRLMIDERYQRNGYATQALQHVIRVISAKADSHELLIRYNIENEVARLLYHKFGFQEIEIDADNIVTALLDLSPSDKQ